MERQERRNWQERFEQIRLARHGIAPGYPLQIPNAVIESVGKVPSRPAGKPMLIWAPHWFEGSPAWEAKGWQRWRELLTKCPDLLLVGELTCCPEDASTYRRQLQRLVTQLGHPRIGFWLAMNAQWCKNEMLDPFRAGWVILIDSRGIVRLTTKLKRLTPSEQEIRLLAQEYARLSTP